MPLRLAHGVRARRVGVSLARALRRHAVTYDCLDGDERGTVCDRLSIAHCALYRVEVVAVFDRGGMPAVCLETFRHVLVEGERGEAFDGDVVVVVEIYELAEFEVARERCGFTRNALHQVAVRDDCVDVTVNDGEALAVKLRREVRSAHRHADAVGEPLPKRPRSYLDARRQDVLGVARSLRAPLAKALQLFEREVVARQV